MIGKLKNYKIAIFLVSIFFLINTCSQKPKPKNQPVVKQGILSLENFDLKSGIVKLDGEWEFYPNQFLNLESLLRLKNSPEELEKKRLWVEAPRSWVSQNLPPLGYGTYVLKIDGLGEDIYSLYLDNIQTAYTVEINEVNYGGLGKISQNQEEHISENKKKVTTFYHKSGEIYLILCVSNYDYAGGGFSSKSSYIGRMEDIDSEREKNITGDIFLSGIFFIFGLYHFSLYAYRKKDQFTLWFGLFCILISIRVLVTSDKYLYDIYPFISVSIGFKMEYLTMYLGSPMFILYTQRLYPKEFINKIYTYINYCFYFLSFGIVLTNQYTYNKTLTLAQMLILIFVLLGTITLIKMARDKVQGARTFLFAISIFFTTIVYDIIVARLQLNASFIVPYGLFIFIFFQSIIIVRRFSEAFEKVENLSESLLQSNRELESMKERATTAYLDLEATQKQLVKSDKMVTLGTMVAGVAHEINTPLSAIRANSESISLHLQTLLKQLNPDEFLLDPISYSEIFEIINYIQENQKSFSTREMRQARKKINETLVQNGYKNIEYLSDTLVDLGLTEEFLVKFKSIDKEKLNFYILFINEYVSISKKTSVILMASERVSKIVKSLKSFMHFEDKEEKTMSDLKEGMETVLTILNNKIKYGIEVIKNYEDIPQIPCYPDELNQVWTNLIHNAVQAMNDSGKLQIDLQKINSNTNSPDIDKRNPDYKGNYISVAIQDSGSGIPPEIRTKIFQAFFTTKPPGEGSGLGLHIIGKILEKHSGALFLESEPGRTRFTIILPESV